MTKRAMPWCGACALLFLAACGGADEPAGGAKAGDQKPAAASRPPADQPAGAPRAPVAKAPQEPQAQKPLPKPRLDTAYIKAMFGRDPSSEEVDNPSTPEKVALGRALYHDASLSKDGARSCAVCHPLGGYGVDGKPVPAGNEQLEHARNAPTTWNAFRQYRQGWVAQWSTVEEFVVPHLLAAEGSAAGDEAALLAKVRANAELAAAFAKVFPGGDAVTAQNVGLALGAFLRTLETKSKWDAWLDGDQKAMSNDELFGLKAFLDVGCITCHGTRLVGGNMPQKTGLLKPYPSQDPGRMALTKAEADRAIFKVPTLLNVEKTGPYMHDGKVATLEEMVTLMADIQLGKKLTDDQHRGIVAFLKALTGPLPDGDAAQQGK